MHKWTNILRFRKFLFMNRRNFSNREGNSEEELQIISPPNEHPIVDIGFNISSPRFSKDLAQILERANRAGTNTLICTGTSLKSSLDTIKLCKKFSNLSRLYSTVGIHPHSAKEMFPNMDEIVQKLRDLITRNRDTVLAVGYFV